MSFSNPLKATSPSVIGSTDQDDDDDSLITNIHGGGGTGGSPFGSFGVGSLNGAAGSGVNSGMYGSVNFSGGSGITFSLTPADGEIDIDLPIVDDSVVKIEELDEDDSFGTRLPDIALLAFDERHGPVLMTFKPEKSISVYELLLINQLIFTEFHKPGQVDALAFVRHNNLEKHFTITLADA